MTKGSHPTKIPETDSEKLPAFFFTFQLELPFFKNPMNLRYILQGVGNKKKRCLSLGLLFPLSVY